MQVNSYKPAYAPKFRGAEAIPAFIVTGSALGAAVHTGIIAGQNHAHKIPALKQLATAAETILATLKKALTPATEGAKEVAEKAVEKA